MHVAQVNVGRKNILGKKMHKNRVKIILKLYRYYFGGDGE